MREGMILKQTADELELIKKYVEIPFLLDVIENDKKRLLSSSLRIRSIYVHHLDHIQDAITKELTVLKRKLQELDIKVVQQSRSPVSLTTEYTIRGYQQHMTLLWIKVKVDITLILTEYLHVDITHT